MDGLPNELRDPVAGKGDEDDESDDGGIGTGTLASDAQGLIAGRRLEADVDRDEGDREPSAKSRGNQATDQRDCKDAPVMTGHVHDGLQHEDGEWNTWYPRDEADDVEDGQDEEKDGSGVVALSEEVDALTETKHDLQDPGDPDELLGEGSRKQKVRP